MLLLLAMPTGQGLTAVTHPQLPLPLLPLPVYPYLPLCYCLFFFFFSVLVCALSFSCCCRATKLEKRCSDALENVYGKMQMLPPEKWTRLVGKKGSGAVVIATSLVAFTTFNFHNDYDMQYMAVHMCECVCVCVTGCAYVCGGAPLGTLTRLSFGG